MVKDFLSTAYPLTANQRRVMLMIGSFNHYLHPSEMGVESNKIAVKLVAKGLLRVVKGCYRFTSVGYKRWEGMRK